MRLLLAWVALCAAACAPRVAAQVGAALASGGGGTPGSSAAGAAGGAGAAPPKQCYPLTWAQLARSGQAFGGATWGALMAESGRKILDLVPAGSSLPAMPMSAFDLASAKLASTFRAPPGLKVTSAASSSPDFPTLLSAGGKSYIINHFEQPQPSTMYLSEVAPIGQELRVVSTQPIPDAAVQGFWHVHHGHTTPWGSHLASEKFPLDCRAYEEFFAPCAAGPAAARSFCGMSRADRDSRSLAQFARYFGFHADGAKYGLGEVDILNNQQAHDNFVKRFKCYNYGANPEVRVLPGGKTQVTKWRTLGRISHEQTLVMGDQKTVYASDDHPNGVFLKFVADRAGDLSSGTLYAMQFDRQRSDATGKPVWDVSWVQLGRGSQAELDKLALGGLRFSDIFEVAEPSGSPPRCPPGFSPANHASLIYAAQDPVTYASYHMECLKVKPGMDMAAAFFETRRLAALKGATTEFEKQEGLAFSPRFKQLYFADARIGKGLTDDSQFNYAGRNAIRLLPNRCGGLFAIDLDDSFSGYQAKLLVGSERLLAGAAKCNPNNVANPERTEYVAGNLLIQEVLPDTGEAVMWAYNLEDASLTRIFAAPQGTELSGINVNRVGNSAYLVFAVQRPLETQPGKWNGGATLRWARSVETVLADLKATFDDTSASKWTAAKTFDSLMGLATEVVSKKVSSEEETSSDLSLMIFYNNWKGIYSQAAPFCSLAPAACKALTDAVTKAGACLGITTSDVITNVGASLVNDQFVENLLTAKYPAYSAASMSTRACIVREGYGVVNALVYFANALNVLDDCSDFHTKNMIYYPAGVFTVDASSGGGAGAAPSPPPPSGAAAAPPRMSWVAMAACVCLAALLLAWQ